MSGENFGQEKFSNLGDLTVQIKAKSMFDYGEEIFIRSKFRAFTVTE